MSYKCGNQEEVIFDWFEGSCTCLQRPRFPNISGAPVEPPHPLLEAMCKNLLGKDNKSLFHVIIWFFVYLPLIVRKMVVPSACDCLQIYIFSFCKLDNNLIKFSCLQLTIKLYIIFVDWINLRIITFKKSNFCNDSDLILVYYTYVCHYRKKKDWNSMNCLKQKQLQPVFSVTNLNTFQAISNQRYKVW